MEWVGCVFGLGGELVEREGEGFYGRLVFGGDGQAVELRGRCLVGVGVVLVDDEVELLLALDGLGVDGLDLGVGDHDREFLVMAEWHGVSFRASRRLARPPAG